MVISNVPSMLISVAFLRTSRREGLENPRMRAPVVVSTTLLKMRNCSPELVFVNCSGVSSRSFQALGSLWSPMLDFLFFCTDLAKDLWERATPAKKNVG